MTPRNTYRQIAAQLRQRVLSCDLAPGAMLPSEHALVESYGVSRGTVRAALALLTSEGLIETIAGRGRRVVGSSGRSFADAAYARIAADLGNRIRAGEFSADVTMPSETELVAEYGVSRNTVRRAYKSLVDDGLVVVRQGSGAFPAGR